MVPLNVTFSNYTSVAVLALAPWDVTIIYIEKILFGIMLPKEPRQAQLLSMQVLILATT